MEIDILKELFSRDIKKLHSEIAAFSDEQAIWQIQKGISNSAGNLCLHLVGNLNSYIGKELGHTDYVRNRPLEFSQKGVPRKILLAMIDETHEVVMDTLSTIDDHALDRDFPVLIFDTPRSTKFILTHLTTHLTWHLGQINYHRRLLDRAPAIITRRESVVGLN